MRKFFPLWVILFACISCNFKIYINGHLDHRIDKSYSYKKSNNDSCFVFGINDVIPDSSVLVALIKIKYGDLADSVGIYSPYYSLLELAKEEAGLTGANIIKIVSYKKPMPFKRAYLTFRFYKLKEPYLTCYRKALDSSNAPNKKICLIHIRNCQYQESNLQIYLNDSLIGYTHNTEVSDESLDSATKIKLTSNFKLYSDGKLSIKSSLRKFPIKDFLVEKNKEYFIKISDAYRSGTPYFMLVTKYDFY